MTDKQFQRAINKTINKLHEYQASLKVAEDEYYRRYMHYPSDKDNDDWIDSMHVNGSPLTVKQVEKSVELHDSTH